MCPRKVYLLFDANNEFFFLFGLRLVEFANQNVRNWMLCDYETRNIDIWKCVRLQEMGAGEYPGQVYQVIFFLFKTVSLCSSCCHFQGPTVTHVAVSIQAKCLVHPRACSIRAAWPLNSCEWVAWLHKPRMHSLNDL